MWYCSRASSCQALWTSLRRFLTQHAIAQRPCPTLCRSRLLRSTKALLSSHGCRQSNLLTRENFIKKYTQKWPSTMPKWCQNDARIVLKWCQSDVKMMPKWFRNDFKHVRKWCQIDPKPISDWSLIDPWLIPDWS